MHSKFKFSFLASGLILAGLQLAACSTTVHPDLGQRVIGDRLENIAPADRDTGAMNHIALFDHTTRMIHQFDLEQMKYERGLKVEQPSLEHQVLFHEDGNYVIDFADQTISIYDNQGIARVNPIRLPGTPVSAAFRPRLGDLVIYDSTNAVGFIKLSPEGHVQSTWVAGPALGTSLAGATNADSTITAADLNEAGQLIASLSDDSIAVIDFDQSLRNQAWAITDRFTSTLTGVEWIAPIRGQPHLMLIQDSAGMSVLDISSHQVMASFPLTDLGHLLVLSKSIDPHFVVGQTGGDSILMGYVGVTTDTNGTVHASFQTKTLNLQADNIEGSRLNLRSNSWMVSQLIPDTATTHAQTDVVSYRLSDLLASNHHDVATNCEIRLLENQVFAMSPNPLGNAESFDLTSSTSHMFQFFNVGH